MVEGRGLVTLNDRAKALLLGIDGTSSVAEILSRSETRNTHLLAVDELAEVVTLVC